MNRIVVVSLVALGLVIALVVGAAAVGRTWFAPEPALAGYTVATDAEAEALGEKVAKAFTARDAAPFDEALDVDAMTRKAVEGQPMTRRQVQSIVEAVRRGVERVPGGTTGKGLVAGFPQGSRAKLLRTRLRDGQREALLRLRLGDGLNYFGLLLARDRTGRVRIVDWHNYAIGEAGHASLRSMFDSAMQVGRRNPAAELLSRLAGTRQSGPKVDLDETTRELARVRDLVSAQPQEAIAVIRRLPPAFRNTRGIWQMRVIAAEAVGAEELGRTLDEMLAQFPNDPGLALLRIDRHLARKEYGQALEAIDTVERSVGGDPYLATLRVSVYLEEARFEDASAALDKALSEEPDLVDLHWASLTLALRSQDHGRALQLLQTLERDFEIEFGDLAAFPDYAHFVKSPEHAVWAARSR